MLSQQRRKRRWVILNGIQQNDEKAASKVVVSGVHTRYHFPEKPSQNEIIYCGGFRANLLKTKSLIDEYQIVGLDLPSPMSTPGRDKPIRKTVSSGLHNFIDDILSFTVCFASQCFRSNRHHRSDRNIEIHQKLGHCTRDHLWWAIDYRECLQRQENIHQRHVDSDT